MRLAIVGQQAFGKSVLEAFIALMLIRRGRRSEGG